MLAKSYFPGFYDHSKNVCLISLIRDPNGKIMFHVEFSGHDCNYSIDSLNLSDIFELIEVFDFGGFYYDKNK